MLLNNVGLDKLMSPTGLTGSMLIGRETVARINFGKSLTFLKGITITAWIRPKVNRLETLFQLEQGEGETMILFNEEGNIRLEVKNAYANMTVTGLSKSHAFILNSFLLLSPLIYIAF